MAGALNRTTIGKFSLPKSVKHIVLYLVHFNSFSVKQAFTNDVLGVRVAQLGVGVGHGEVEHVEVEIAKIHCDLQKFSNN